MEFLLVVAYILLVYVILGFFGNALVFTGLHANADLRERPLYIFLRLLAINDTFACLLAIPNVVASLIAINTINAAVQYHESIGADNGNDSAVTSPLFNNTTSSTSLAMLAPVTDDDWSDISSQQQLGQRSYTYIFRQQTVQNNTILLSLAAASTFGSKNLLPPAISTGSMFGAGVCAVYGPLSYVWLMSTMPALMMLASNRLIGVALPSQYSSLFTRRFCYVIWATFVWMPVGIIMLLYLFQLIGKFYVLPAAAAHICWDRGTTDSSLRTLWVMVMYIPLAVSLLLYLLTGARYLRRWLTIKRQMVQPHKVSTAEWASSDLQRRVHGTLLCVVMLVLHVVCVLPLRILEDAGVVYDDDFISDGESGVPWRRRGSLLVFYVMMISVGGKWIIYLAHNHIIRRAVRIQLGFILPFISPEREDPLLPLRERVQRLRQQISTREQGPKLVPSSTSNPFHATPTAIKLQPLMQVQGETG